MLRKSLSTAIAFILCLLFTETVLAQGTSQTIKGTIIDKQTQSALPGVTVTIVGDNAKGTVTDANGRFRLSGIIPGRYDIRFNFIGYKEFIAPNVEVTSGKEVALDIGLENGASNLNEVVVGGAKKHETINELSTVSGRSFTMEEVNRYSGGRSDPSRLVANFAGVSAPDDKQWWKQ